VRAVSKIGDVPLIPGARFPAKFCGIGWPDQKVTGVEQHSLGCLTGIMNTPFPGFRERLEWKHEREPEAASLGLV
jgi:hypothetical protein